MLQKQEIIVLLLIAVMIIGVSCAKKMSYQPKSLPANAKVLDTLGNGWVYFELHDNVYLYYKEYSGYVGWSAVTKVGTIEEYQELKINQQHAW